MIVAKKKPIEEIIDEIKGYQKILIAGCNECVTVCESGGKKEVAVLASALRMYFLNQGKDVKIDEVTLERQCDHEYLEEIRKVIDQYDAVLSLACGVGVQFLAEKYHAHPDLSGRGYFFHGGDPGTGHLDGKVPGVRSVHSCQRPQGSVLFPDAPRGSSMVLAAVQPKESAKSAGNSTVHGNLLSIASKSWVNLRIMSRYSLSRTGQQNGRVAREKWSGRM